MWRGEALQHDMKQVLGLPRLPAWLQPSADDDEVLARRWTEVRAFAASPDVDVAANELRRQALAWAKQRVEPGCDLDLLPRLGYPAVDVLWLREAIETYFAALPRLLIVCGCFHELASAGEATNPGLDSSDLGWSRAAGVSLVLQDMQRTLRTAHLPPEWTVLGQLPTYLYHLWPSLRAVMREAEAQAGIALDALPSLATLPSLREAVAGHAAPTDAAVSSPVVTRLAQALPLQFMLLTVIAVRLGIRKAEYGRGQHARGLGLEARTRVETGHNTLETDRGRDPAPCHT